MNFSAETLHRIVEALEQLRARPEGSRLQLAQKIEGEFSVDVGDYAAVAMKLGMPITHVVILIHGIRDDGDWFAPLERELKDVPLVTVSLGGYGYLPLADFLKSEKRQEKLNEVVQALRRASEHNKAVSVICHSFGTWCVTRAILENPDIALFRLVMCGSIVPREFPWDNVPATMPTGRIVNDCGNQDDWPIRAKRLSSELFGDTGRFGFGRDPVKDRWHDVGHSGFFTKELMSKYWVPFIARGEIVQSPAVNKPPRGLLRWIARRVT